MNSILGLLSQLDFWRGVGRLVLDLTLIVAMYYVVMAISGHPVRRGSQNSTSTAPDDNNAPAEPARPIQHREAHAHAAGQDPAHVAHLDLLASLKQALELEGATIVLIVFAVLILSINHVLSGAEVATILAGITGYVLGARKQPPAASGPSSPDKLSAGGSPDTKGSIESGQSGGKQGGAPPSK